METIVISNDGETELLGDLYKPEGVGPHPVVIGLSGGGWRRGGRGDLAQWGRYFAAAGIAFFSADYRRAVHEPVFPRNAEDAVAALRFIAREGARFGLDPARIGLLGASAGAHLGALAVLSEAGSAVAPKVFIGVYGIYDLVAHWQADLWRNAATGEDLTERFIGCVPHQDQRRYFDASPIRQIDGAARNLKVLLVWGEKDGEVSPRQSEEFHRALVQAGAMARTIPVPGAGHFWFSDDPVDDPSGFTAGLAPRLLRFLDRHLVMGR